MQKIWIIGFFFETRVYAGFLKFGCYYLQYVPASKLFYHAEFEVLEAITLLCLIHSPVISRQVSFVEFLINLPEGPSWSR